MEETPLVKLKYPSFDTDPYFEEYQTQMQQLDQMLLFMKVQNNAFVAKGGTFTLASNIFSWTADFEIPIFHYGYKVNVRFGADGANRALALPDGYCIVVELPSAMNSNIVKNAMSLSQLTPLNHSQWVMGWRSGNNVYFKGLGQII